MAREIKMVQSLNADSQPNSISKANCATQMLKRETIADKLRKRLQKNLGKRIQTTC